MDGEKVQFEKISGKVVRIVRIYQNEKMSGKTIKLEKMGEVVKLKIMIGKNVRNKEMN